MIDEQQAGGVFIHLAPNGSEHGTAAAFVRQSQDLKVGYHQGDLWREIRGSGGSTPVLVLW